MHPISYAKNMPTLLVDSDTHVGDNNDARGKYMFPQVLFIKASGRTYGDLGMVMTSFG